jgi:hypothetical protein
MNRIFFFFVLCFFVRSSYACDCPDLEKLSDNVLKQYSLIFRGHADSASVVKGMPVVWFTIEELLKGTAAKVSCIYTGIPGSCQVKVEKGDEWIIYANYMSYGKPKLDFCSRSRKHFSDGTNDYFIVLNGMSYSDELSFLKSRLGVQAMPETSVNSDQEQRELIHPDHVQMLCWLLASLLGFLGIFYLLKKFLR